MGGIEWRKAVKSDCFSLCGLSYCCDMTSATEPRVMNSNFIILIDSVSEDFGDFTARKVSSFDWQLMPSVGWGSARLLHFP